MTQDLKTIMTFLWQSLELHKESMPYIPLEIQTKINTLSKEIKLEVENLNERLIVELVNNLITKIKQ